MRLRPLLVLFALVLSCSADPEEPTPGGTPVGLDGTGEAAMDAPEPNAPPPPILGSDRPGLENPRISEVLLTKAKVQKIKTPKAPRRRVSKAVGSKGVAKKSMAMPSKEPAPSKPKELGGLMGGLGLLGKGSGGGGHAGPSANGQSARFAQPRSRQGREDRHAARPTGGAAPNVRYLSADDSNSAASPVLVRQTIYAGRYVDPSIVRAYEFLNYHSFEYAPGRDLATIDAQMRPTDNPDAFSLQVAVRGPDREREQMGPLHAVVLLDTSGSMAGNPSRLAHTFVRRFAQRLQPQDQLSVVVANRSARTILEAVPADDALAPRLETALKTQAQPNDVTNLERGIVTAYDVAVRHKSAEHATRVIVISDGAANYGRLSRKTIEKHAKDADGDGIYLAGIGIGTGFEDRLMDSFTDRGRGAYLFLDRLAEIDRVLDDGQFVANFDVALKDVRLKMEMPAGWRVKAFHGEQISRKKSKVTPQYLSANDQMIYHMLLEFDGSQAGAEEFTFEAEFTPVGAGPQRVRRTFDRSQMNAGAEIVKGNALVAFAESLRKVRYPLEPNREANLALWDETTRFVEDAARHLQDLELEELVRLAQRYRETLDLGERFPDARDEEDTSPDAVLGIPVDTVQSVEIRSASSSRAVKGLSRLLNSRKLVPMEGYRFLAMSTGPVGNPWPAGGGELRMRRWPDPQPRFMGKRRVGKDWEPAHDLTQITLELTAPAEAQSFSFDFNYLSAEYPEFVNQSYNDTFYAILQAGSTNDGKKTNISFDANRNSIEVDNNYFENKFQPIPTTGTGFDRHGATGWLRTSWPIEPGETFTITFSIHDEGDAIYDSLVLLDNFKFHAHPAVGTTDPLN